MLRNFWYAIEHSAAVGAAPVKARVLGQDLVLYRGPGGRVVAQTALCPHRGGDLSLGQVVDGCLRCPYHGWRFDAGGACTRIPANPPDAPIPKKALLATYPVEERYGLVWAFLGDLPPAERPPIPPFPEYGRPQWRAISGDFHFRAHYARVMENGLDFAHGPFVHSSSFGNINRPEVPEYDVLREEYGGHATVILPAQEPRGLWRWLSRHRPDVPVTLSFYMPNVLRIHLRPAPSWEVIIFDSNVPVDEGRTRTLWVSLRNFLRGGWADRDARTRTLAIFREDQPIVEGVRPVVPPIEISGELPLRSDQLPLAYRRLRRHFFEKGWGLPQAPQAG